MPNFVYALAIAAIIPFAASATGCSKKSEAASCDKVADHLIKHAPEQYKSHMKKPDMVKQCEKKMSKEERSCAMAAKDFKAITACKGKGKKAG